MHAWIDTLLRILELGDTAVLVSVARVEGSAPREAGARMIVASTSAWHTIGGGHLEWKAIAIARDMLAADPRAMPPRRLARLALGPSLGQCCGGAVILAFERVGKQDLVWLRQLERYLRDGTSCSRTVQLGACADPVRLVPLGHAGGETSCTLRGDNTDTAVLHETLAARLPSVMLFGAGHVGTALVRVLATLPCALHWVDERAEALPSAAALAALLGTHQARVTSEVNDMPDEAVDHAPPQTSFLVMTHDHARDFALTERILRRGDFAFLGLIGSRTKRRQFEHRLAARGMQAREIARLTCPIGIAGIRGKAPEAIAIAVAAQLMQVWETKTVPRMVEITTLG